ncbi:MAG: molecular chaperone DnaJ [Candidatus Magasanikbacteria bacterium]|jgi:molecular chaperone DnaJ|nr:molecular chaperone DnaJ [Candidatus Magasanikbacteria bacterium]
MSKDYYKTLGVEKNASQEEIKKAFRKKAHKHHPDKPTGDEAKFKEVNEAYQVVGDKEKRAQYDQYGSDFSQQGGFGGGMSWEDYMRATRGQQQGGGFGGVDFGDIFGEMFGFGGGGRRGGGQVRGRDIQVDVELSFEEAAFGIERSINLRKKNACDDCSGTGAEKDSKMNTCGECSGQGQVVRIQRTILGNMQTQAMCPICSGAGKIPEKSCKTCGGDGSVTNESDMQVKIPAGIHHGAQIRLTGHGEYPGTGGAAGDLYVRVHIKRHDIFVRDGFDVHMTLTINYAQAVLGDTIEIDTLDGKKNLVVPAGTQPHQKIRLKGLGIQQLQGSRRGDHYVQVLVDVPKKPGKKAKKLIQELKDEL